MRKRVTALVLAVLLLLTMASGVSATEISGMEDLFSAWYSSVHVVMLTTDFSGNSFVEDGQDYTFCIVDSSFNYEVMAYMDGEAVQATNNGDGSFTIRNVTGSLMISGRKQPKPVEELEEEPVEEPEEVPSVGGSVTTAPQPVVTQQTPTVQPAPAPEVPTEEPEIIPETPIVEEIIPEEPEAVPVKPETKPVEKPAVPVEPVPEVVEEKGPFPWWIPALAALGIGVLALIVLVLSRRTVTFAVEGGTVVPAQRIWKGHRIARPAEPEKSGAIFAGWFRDEGRTQRWDFENTAVKTHMTLYAKWLAVR